MNNYWFPFTTLVINLLIICFMPKKLTKREIYNTWMALAAITLYSDILVGQILDLFDFGPKGIQFSDLIIEALLPPSFGIIFLNFMPNKKVKFIVYFLFWVAFSLVFEWLSVLVDYEKLKGWSLWYSIPVYSLVFLYLRWHISFISNKN